MLVQAFEFFGSHTTSSVTSHVVHEIVTVEDRYGWWALTRDGIRDIGKMGRERIRSRVRRDE